MPLDQVRISSKALSFFEIIRIKRDETSKKRFQDEPKQVCFRKKKMLAIYPIREGWSQKHEDNSVSTLTRKPMRLSGGLICSKSHEATAVQRKQRSCRKTTAARSRTGRNKHVERGKETEMVLLSYHYVGQGTFKLTEVLLGLFLNPEPHLTSPWSLSVAVGLFSFLLSHVYILSVDLSLLKQSLCVCSLEP